MARTVTLEQLRDDARLYCDNRTSSPASAHITDAELTRLINMQLAELHEVLVSARSADYVGTLGTGTISLVSGTSLYDLPEDFMQLVAFWIDRGNQDQEEIRALSTNANVPGALRYTWSSHCRKFYRIRGGQLEMLPTPTETIDASIRYVPAFSDLVNDGDTYDGVNGWEKLVTMGAALEMRAIERIDPGILAQMYAQQRARIEAMAGERQAIEALEVKDNDPGSRWFWGRNGWWHP